MAARKRRRILFRGIAGILIGIVVLLLLFPVWLPWLLRPLAKPVGIQFGAYERVSYAHFAARDITFTNGNVRFTAERVEAHIQSIWLRRTDDVAINGWKLVIAPSERSPEPRNPKSAYELYQQVRRIVRKVQEWIPKGSATGGSIYFDNEIIEVPRLTVSVPNVSAQVSFPKWKQDVQIIAAVEPTGGDHFALTNSTLGIGLNLSAVANNEELTILSTNQWQTNSFILNSRFARDDRAPSVADLAANAFSIPPELLPTNAIQSFNGSLEAHWRTNQFELRLDALVTSSVSDQTGPITINVQATGNREELVLQRAKVAGSWVDIEVKQTRLIYKAPFLPETGALAVFVDLGKQTNLPVSGRVKADILVPAISNGIPKISFAAAGTNVVFPKIATQDLAITGSLDWPLLTIREFQANLGAATVSASGELNGTNRALAGSARLTRSGETLAELKISTTLDRQPPRGEFSARINGLDSSLLADFIPRQTAKWGIDHADLSGTWSNGPVSFHLAGDGQWHGSNQPIFSISADLLGTGDGISISRLDANANGELVAKVRGTLPLTLVLDTSTNVVQIEWEKAVQAQATVLPHGFFWNELTNRVPLVLKNPDLRAELRGTLRQPRGHLSLGLDELRYRDAPPEVPPLAEIRLDADVSPTNAEMSKFTFFIAKQRVDFSGQIPLHDEFWTNLLTRIQKPDWRTATARLQIQRAQIAAFAPLVRRNLSPQGLIKADISLVPGGNLDGELIIDGASTRPLPGLGVIQDIELVCAFAGQTARIKAVGSIGGANVFTGGEVDLGPEQWAKGKLPPFKMQITGENVPLNRSIDSIIRADLNTAFINTSNGPPLISGNVHLRNSLYLRDLRDLIPGQVATPTRRPPYFSIEELPLADWRLDLTVTGKRFLHVRSPLFNGELSADLQLSGTLKDPLAVGDLRIDAGIVRLPFANLPITQGMVTLSSANPYRPELFIAGAERAFGYDVKMQITGPADKPLIQFSSTPPLSSEQILLMLTAGEIPRQDQFSFTTEQRAQRLALFLGRNLLSEIGLGGDVSRLTIKSGEDISETGKPTYSVEYELTEDWSVIGQYDRFNDFNLMLKWRVYAK